MSRENQPQRQKTVPILIVAILGILSAHLISRSVNPEESMEEQDVAEAPPPPTFEMTEEGILALSPFIRSAHLSPATDSSAGKQAGYLASITIEKEPHTLGAGDWNVIAHDVRSLSELLLKQPQTSGIRFSFADPEQHNLEWARATVSRDRLPGDWEELSYLKFFGRIEPEATTRESETWLCEFYRQYASARPGGNLPETCVGL
ncbi:MAG: hypothetical protein FIA97_10575 [Methylococcaceae bacterium]|nr:hypothetical protein [Methylococcaceae bacterium]